MRDYARTLGRRFENKLRNMGPHQHWIDMGAGEANAIGDYLSSVFPQNQAQVSALSVVRPGTAVQSDRFRYHEGRVLSEYTVTDLGQADLITDYYGPAFYAGTLDQTIEQYGHLLREGGEAWIVLAQPGQNAEISINGVKLDGSTRARKVIERWLAASSGFELVEANYEGAIGIRRTSAPVRMATLRPTRINAGAAFLAYDYAFTPDHVRPEAARHGNE